MPTIGVVAGSGRLPALFSDIAKSKGDKVIGIGLKGVTDDRIEEHVDRVIWVELGAVQKSILALMTSGIKKIVLLGKLKKDLFFKNNEALDGDTKTFLGKLNDRRDYSMLNEAAKFLSRFGIEILDPTPYMADFIPAKGAISKRGPTKEEGEDIACAMRIAGELARLDIGQAVAVKNRTVIALEAVEGTDEVISRAGGLSMKGFVLAKVARPDQDMRFDVPLVGLETVEALAKAGGTALAMEAGKTFLIDRDRIKKLADEKDLAIVVV